MSGSITPPPGFTLNPAPKPPPGFTLQSDQSAAKDDLPWDVPMTGAQMRQSQEDIRRGEEKIRVNEPEPGLEHLLTAPLRIAQRGGQQLLGERPLPTGVEALEEAALGLRPSKFRSATEARPTAPRVEPTSPGAPRPAPTPPQGFTLEEAGITPTPEPAPGAGPKPGSTSLAEAGITPTHEPTPAPAMETETVAQPQGDGTVKQVQVKTGEPPPPPSEPPPPTTTEAPAGMTPGDLRAGFPNLSDEQFEALFRQAATEVPKPASPDPAAQQAWGKAIMETMGRLATSAAPRQQKSAAEAPPAPEQAPAAATPAATEPEPSPPQQVPASSLKPGDQVVVGDQTAEVETVRPWTGDQVAVKLKDDPKLHIGPADALVPKVPEPEPEKPAAIEAHGGPWSPVLDKDGEHAVNPQGVPLYENPNGVRAQMEGGIPFTERTAEHPEKGLVPHDVVNRKGQFLTKEEAGRAAAQTETPKPTSKPKARKPAPAPESVPAPGQQQSDSAAPSPEPKTATVADLPKTAAAPTPIPGKEGDISESTPIAAVESTLEVPIDEPPDELKGALNTLSGGRTQQTPAGEVPPAEEPPEELQGQSTTPGMEQVRAGDLKPGDSVMVRGPNPWVVESVKTMPNGQLGVKFTGIPKPQIANADQPIDRIIVAPAEAPKADQAPPPKQKREPTPYVSEPKEPKRLVQFLRDDFTVGRPGDIHTQTSHGGLRDIGGDLAAIIGGKKSLPALRGGRGFRGLINNETGSTLDDATLRAWQAGYFPEHDERPSINDLLNKIDEDLNRDNPAYSHHDQDAVDAYHEAVGRNGEINRLAALHDIPTAGLTHDQFFDELADKLSLDELAAEHARLEAYHPVLRDEFEAAAKEWAAFHATPHDFDQFDLSKIGTGEGAQAYGHGLYFAESLDVHKSYLEAFGCERGTRAVDDFLRKNRGLKLSSGQVVDKLKGTPAAPLLADPDVVEDIRELLKDYAPQLPVTVSDLKRYRHINDAAERLIKANSLTVRIRAKPEDMLDWDKPLSEQSEHVRRALTPRGLGLHQIGPVGDKGYYGWADASGKRIGPLRSGSAPDYVFEPRELGSSIVRGAGDWKPQEASEALLAAGVKGIRYADGNSRNITPTITFDDKKWQMPADLDVGTGVERSKNHALARVIANDGDVDQALRELGQMGQLGAQSWLRENENRVGAVERPTTHNIVIFDPADIQITHKNGEPIKPKDWNPDQFYGNDQARSLEDLENEYRQEIAAAGSRQRNGGDQEPGNAGAPSGEGAQAAGFGGDAARTSGRDATQGAAGQTDLLGKPITDPAPRKAPEPTIRTDPNQVVMPGMGPSAVQAQAARDAAGPRSGQDRANEGLFAPKEAEQPELTPQNERPSGWIKPGELLWSKSGRQLSPVPKFNPGGGGQRKVTKNLADWLVAEAQKEKPPASETRWIADAIKEMDPGNLSTSDADLLRETLFGDQNGPLPVNRRPPWAGG